MEKGSSDGDRIRTRVEGRRVRVHHTQAGNPFGEWRLRQGGPGEFLRLGQRVLDNNQTTTNKIRRKRTARQTVRMEDVEKVQEERRTGRQKKKKTAGATAGHRL